ncbi:unnamed protein product [Polarella glacialis]|uniref:Alveolin domain containing intermediate filament IMC4 n=1 Tax=Polarella glacialis TaxID=89957 RepID=A0A813D9K0_POLGL|nr:unnamed protein product [Polarella glacialis]
MVVQEVVKHVPRIEVQIQERIVEHPEVHYVEKIVEVPQTMVQVVDKHVSKMVIQEVVKHVPKINVQVQERIIEHPEVHVVEKLVEVPQTVVQVVDRHVSKMVIQEVVKHVPKINVQVQERIVEHPEIHMVEKLVEVPQTVVQVVDRHVPKVHIQEVVKHVPKIQVQIQERIIEVPQVQVVERLVEVPQVHIQTVLKHVPKLHIQEVVKHVAKAVPKVVIQEVLRHVPKHVIETREIIVEVPCVQVKERIVEHPQIHVQEVTRHVPKVVEVQEIVRNVSKVDWGDADASMMSNATFDAPTLPPSTPAGSRMGSLNPTVPGPGTPASHSVRNFPIEAPSFRLPDHAVEASLIRPRQSAARSDLCEVHPDSVRVSTRDALTESNFHSTATLPTSEVSNWPAHNGPGAPQQQMQMQMQMQQMHNGCGAPQQMFQQATASGPASGWGHAPNGTGTVGAQALHGRHGPFEVSHGGMAQSGMSGGFMVPPPARPVRGSANQGYPAGMPGPHQPLSEHAQVGPGIAVTVSPDQWRRGTDDVPCHKSCSEVSTLCVCV